MSKPDPEQSLALGGILAALVQVQQLARFGECDNERVASILEGILITQPQSTREVYPDPISLEQGLKKIDALFGDQERKDTELMRYLVGVLTLERKLSKSKDSLQTLGERISQVHRQLSHFSITDEQVLANFSSIYSDVISDLGPKIQIVGNPTHLQRPLIQYKVRALLLAAMRSAVLWRQLGGSRMHFLFSRNRLLQATKQNLLTL